MDQTPAGLRRVEATTFAVSVGGAVQSSPRISFGVFTAGLTLVKATNELRFRVTMRTLRPPTASDGCSINLVIVTANCSLIMYWACLVLSPSRSGYSYYSVYVTVVLWI